MEPQRAVGNLRGQIDVVGPVVERVEELGVGLPGPRKALVQGGAGDVLDALHQLDQALVVGRAHRREADAAVAGHHRSEEHTSELPSLMRTSYAVFCLKKK